MYIYIYIYLSLSACVSRFMGMLVSTWTPKVGRFMSSLAVFDGLRLLFCILLGFGYPNGPCRYMVYTLAFKGPKCMPYTYMDPLG